MSLKQFKKKAFTLIELIIVIILIGILAGMSLPKFIGVQRNAKVAAMVRDIDTLEKAIKLYENDNDSLPIYDVGINGSNLDNPTKDMEDIYLSLKEILEISDDGEEYLYKINMGESSKYHSKTKYGHGKTDTDFYVYSTKTDKVYYYGYLVNDKKEYQHSEVPIKLNVVNNLVAKTPSIKLKGPIIKNPIEKEDLFKQDLLFVTSNGYSGSAEEIGVFKKDATFEYGSMNGSHNYLYIELPKDTNDLEKLKNKKIIFDMYIKSPSYGIYLRRNIENSYWETFGPNITHTYILNLTDIRTNKLIYEFYDYPDKKFIQLMNIYGNGSGTPEISNIKFID